MTSITTNNKSYPTTATQTRQATERSVDIFKTGAKTFADQLGSVNLPTVDLTESVTRYFEYLQKAVDFNRDLATQWAELVTTLSGSVREQAQQVTGIVKDQTRRVADLTVKQAEKAEKSHSQADKVEQAQREQAEEAEEARRPTPGKPSASERDEAKKAQQQAREAYEGLTKAELSDQLAERGLPKTGNIEELIERLVSADSE